MITTICILLFAGFLKAVKDRLDAPKDRYGNYFTGHIFPKYGTFWNKGTGRRFIGFYFDAWHIADFLYILSWCLFAMSYRECFFTHTVDPESLWSVLKAIGIEILPMFTITQTSFNIFYFIFKKR